MTYYGRVGWVISFQKVWGFSSWLNFGIHELKAFIAAVRTTQATVQHINRDGHLAARTALAEGWVWKAMNPKPTWTCVKASSQNTGICHRDPKLTLLMTAEVRKHHQNSCSCDFLLPKLGCSATLLNKQFRLASPGKDLVQLIQSHVHWPQRAGSRCGSWWVFVMVFGWGDTWLFNGSEPVEVVDRLYHGLYHEKNYHGFIHPRFLPGFFHQQ